MYRGVPMSSPVPVIPLSVSSARAMPKSITRGPTGESRTLDGLRSRCTMPALWIAVSAVATPTASASRLEPRNGPEDWMASCRLGPSTYSVTTYSWSPSRSASSTAAVQKRRTRRADSASRRKRTRNCSCWLYSALITLMATRCPVWSWPR